MTDNIHAAFEREVSLLSTLDDPLTVFERHYQYLRTNNSDSPEITKLLERATQTFVDDRRYRNDPRYLRLWLEYARRCREPEDIYAFLAMRGIAADLAAYYEEYAQYLEGKGDGKAGLILQAGVDRNAQPIERLRRRLTEYRDKNPMTARGQKGEVRGYKCDLIKIAVGGETSFEEVRARSWRRAGSILKASSYIPPTFTSAVLQASNADDELADLDDGGAIDPDELTHISVYKDNTADLRELARSLTASKETFKENILSSTLANASGTAAAISFDQFIGGEKPPARMFGEQSTIGGGTNDILDEFMIDRRHARLSLIPEESDAATSVSGFIPSLLARSKKCTSVKLTVEAVSSARNNLIDAILIAPGKIVRSEEPIQGRITAMNKSIGRDGQGNNQTVASLRIAVGHYFIERRLGKRALLAVDLDADLTSGIDLHQLVLKISDSVWEPCVLRHLAGTTGVPTLGKVCQHPDAILFTRTYFPHGSFSIFSSTSSAAKIDEKLLLFWTREIVSLLSKLHAAGVIHGAIALDQIMVRLGTQLLSSPVFDPLGGGGWAERGVAFVGYGSSLVLTESQRDATLDADLHSIYRDRLGEQCPTAVGAIDLFGFCRVLSLLLPPPGHRKYEGIWQQVEVIIHDQLQSPSPTWSAVAAIYPKLSKILDEALVRDSTVLPTLKSLLTKLEISLLERPVTSS